MRVMKRKLLWFGLGSLCFVAVLAGLWLLWKDDLINQSSYEQIRRGMSIEEVRARLGSPGDDLDDLDNPIDLNDGPQREVLDMHSEGDWVHVRGTEWQRRIVWSGQNGWIVIRLDPEQRITDKAFLTLKPLSVIERLRHLVGRFLPS
jgi:hypothetical protein